MSVSAFVYKFPNEVVESVRRLRGRIVISICTAVVRGKGRGSAVMDIAHGERFRSGQAKHIAIHAFGCNP